MADYQKYRNRLEDYLLLKEIIPCRGAKSFWVHCFHPEHEDKNPSCIVDGNEFLCYGCGFRGDIYDAVGILENIPDYKGQYQFLEDFFKEANNA